MSDDVRFSIFVAPSMSSEDLPVLTMRVGYLGEGNAYLPIRFAVAPLGDVRLRVVQGERELPFARRVRLAPARVGDFLAVESGDCVVAGYPLGDGYRLERGHRYTVTAELVCPEAPQELTGYRVITGRYPAQPVEIALR